MSKATMSFTLPVATSAFSQSISKGFFGADCNNGFGTQFNQTPLQDGAGNAAVLQVIRLWDCGVKWTQVQTGTSTFSWANLDKWVAACQAMHYDMIYVFGATPTFIATPSGGTGCSNVAGYSNNCCSPTDVNTDGSGTDATFKGFVTAIINRYGPGTFKYWELWNEQDSKNFFSGTMQQAVRMGQDAAAIIRSLDPTATILSPSFHGPTASTFFVNYCTTSVNGIAGWKNFDVVNVHMRASDTNQTGNKDANVDPTCFFTAYNQTQAALSTLKTVNKIDLTALPLWDDEHGYIKDQGGNGYPPAINDPYMLAAYVAVSTILRASVNLQQQSYYCWTSNATSERLQGNPSGTAWDVIANLLIGKSVNGSVPAVGYSLGSDKYGPSVFTVSVNGGLGLFVWDQSQTCDNSSGKEVCTFTQFKYPNGFTKWADIFGNTGTLSGGTVSIGCCPLYLS